MRLLRHLSLKDTASNLGSLAGITTLDQSALFGHDGAMHGMQKADHQEPGAKTKRIKICYDFLSSIDHSGQLTAAFSEDCFDDIKYKRNLVSINVLSADISNRLINWLVVVFN